MDSSALNFVKDVVLRFAFLILDVCDGGQTLRVRLEKEAFYLYKQLSKPARARPSGVPLFLSNARDDVFR